MTSLDEVKAKLDTFSPAKIKFVANVVSALANPPRANIRHKDTWLTAWPDWIEYFGLALSVHHGTTPEPLGLTAFETVFRNACRSVDWDVRWSGGPTHRFADLQVTVPGMVPRRLSLKSTAAKRLSRRSAHISKLTEAAWIQDERTAQGRRQRLQALFLEYCGAVDAIVMLRAFRQERNRMPSKYELLEVPTSIFSAVQAAPLDVFQRGAPIVECEVNGEVAAKVAVDRSDAKITVRNILLSACIVHAEWHKHDELDESDDRSEPA